MQTRLIAGLIVSLIVLVTPAAAQEEMRMGTVAGYVYDAGTGQPVRAATVVVVGLPESRTVTDVDGHYALKIPVGAYSVSVAAKEYLSAVIEGVVVTPREITDGSTVLALKSEVTSVDVVASARVETATAQSVLTERKLAASVTNSISAEEISQTTASDAAGALKEVTGVSVVGDGYVYVRGLGERYSATMLNDSLITTTEPDKRVVPLDLFPAELIDKLEVVKTYTPDLPGEFAGGLVKIETVQFPDRAILQVSGKIGFNTQTTFNNYLSYHGGGTDFFGFDDGTRALPSDVPADKRLFRGLVPDKELAKIGRSFESGWQNFPVPSARPSQSYNVVAGNTFGKLGVVGAFSFSNEISAYPQIFRTYAVSRPGEIARQTDFNHFHADTQPVRMGGVLNLAYNFSPKHRLSIRNTLTHEATKEARRISGFDGAKQFDLMSERLQWVQRSLIATQVEGEHLMGPWNGMFTWQLGISRATRDEPDLREVLRTLRPDGTSRFLEDPFSGTRFFSNLDDILYEPSAEYSIPFYKGQVTGSFNVGFRSTFRHRDFGSRRFRYIPAPGTKLDLTLPNDILFAPFNINRDGMQFREVTRTTDSYLADMTIYAGYFNFDVALSTKWRIIAGARVEDSNHNVPTVDPLNPSVTPVVTTLLNRNVLPGINVVYALTPRQNLRFAFGGTVSRPDFRELSPFDFTNIVGGYSTNGNPDLVQTSIKNFDARWEWFLGGDELLAASFFYKKFKDPIEMVLQPGGNQRRSWLNAQGARNYGVELEARRNLKFITERLRELSIASNFTFVDSQIEISPNARTPLTNLKRPLLGQSRYLYNVALEWNRPNWRSSTRAYVNYFSKRIAQVGAFGLPDVIEQGRTSLDVVYEYLLREKGNWNLRFDARNLTNQDYVWTQGGEIQQFYRLGRSFSVGMSYSFLQ